MGAYNRVTLQPGYVLHHWPYRDTSLLVEIITRDHGRIGVVARGAKRVKSRLYGILQPFIPLVFSWTDKGELGTLNSAEPQGMVRWPNGRAMINGFYVNELLLRLLHRHDPHPNLFDEYCRVLQGLSILNEQSNTGSTVNHGEQRSLRIFEKNLLRELGYGLVLDHDAISGEAVRIDEVYDYVLDKGPVLNSNVSDPSIKHRNDSECVMLSGSSLISLAQDKLEDARSLQESKKLMRAVLKRYLGDKPLGSRRLFHDLSRPTAIQTITTINT